VLAHRVHADTGTDRRPVLPGPAAFAKTSPRAARRAAAAGSPRGRRSASCAPIRKSRRGRLASDARIYSGYEGAAIAPRHVDPVDDKTFLRGTQVTDPTGGVRCEDLPGLVPGCTPHVHLKFASAPSGHHPKLFSRQVTNAVYHGPVQSSPDRTYEIHGSLLGQIANNPW